MAAALSLSLTACLALSLNAAVHRERQSRLPATIEDAASSEIQSRADRVERDAANLMALMAAPLREARAEAGAAETGSDRMFALLEQAAARTRFLADGRGLSVHDAGGAPLAWLGASYPIPASLLAGLPSSEEAIVYRAVAERHLTRLYAFTRAGSRVVASEATLVSRLDPRLRDRAFPSLRGDRTAQVQMHDFRREMGGTGQLFLRHGDRYPGVAERERPRLFVGLRAPDRTFLGEVRLTGLSLADMAQEVQRQHDRAAAALILIVGSALAVIAIGARRSAFAPDGAAHLAVSLGVVWSLRLLLSWLPLPLPEGDLFGPSLFASARFDPLLRSPADLWLTALALFVSALLIHRSLSAGSPALRRILGRASPWAGLAALAALLVWAAAWLPSFASSMVTNASVSLLLADLMAPSTGTLLLQSAALLVVAAILQPAQWLLSIAIPQSAPSWIRAAFPRPGDGVSRWALTSLLPGLMIAAMIHQPLFAPATRQATEALFQDQLRPEVAAQHEARVALLQSTLEALQARTDLPDRLDMAESELASLALDLWHETPLSGSGYSASLRVEDAEGRILSRFAWNLPPAFDLSVSEEQGGRAEPIASETSIFMDVRKTILHAHHPVESRGEIVGLITVHVLDEFDNLPFLTPETPYVRALAPHARRITTLPASRRVWHAVYTPDGQHVFSNQRQAARPPDDLVRLIISPDLSEWKTVVEEGVPARYLFFGDGHHLFALGFSLPTKLEMVARMLRMMLLGLVLLAILVAPILLSPWHRRWRDTARRLVQTLGRTHYRKLLATFAVTTVVPLLGLTLLMRGYIISQVEEEIEERGWQGIQSAASLVRTIMTTEEQAPLEDDTLYWISQQVGHDINLYQGGEIAATSRRELFSSGLISPRVDGRIYRRLVYEGRRVATGKQTVRDFAYRTVTALGPAAPGRPASLLSLPLDAQTAEAERRAREVGDVILITFVAMVILLGVVGYVLARKISRPMRDLRAAAGRIAAGDLDATVTTRASDETGDLILTFNRMARAIKDQREDLERRRDYIEKILLNATIGVVSLGRAGQVVTVNPAALTLLETPGLEPGADLRALIAAVPSLAPLASLMEEGHAAREAELRLSGGPPDRTVRARAVPFLEGRGIILLLEDVTETVRSNRLAAWAEMARRIAHEIKNPLTPIQLSAEHIRRVHAEGHPEFPRVLQECLLTIMDEVANLREISAEFSAYARIPTPRKEPTEMSPMLAEIVRPYQRAMPPGTTLAAEIPEGLPVLDADRSLLRRAMVNLIENGLQAMPTGGMLTIRANAGPGEIFIEIADTGVGMDEAALARLFEPYFSTKDAGTGLGLAIARKAIEEHGGRIEVRSEPRRGTTMTVVLPLPKEAGTRRSAAGQRVR